MSVSEATAFPGDAGTPKVRHCNRVAAAVLGVEAAFVLAAAGQLVLRILPDLASADAHRSGDAGATVLYGAIPFGLAAVFTLVVAWRLWHGRRRAPVLALLCTAAAGLLTWSLISPGFNNVLWAAGIVLREPNTWFVRGSTFYYEGTVPSFGPMPGQPHQLPYGLLDDLFFWVPGVLVVGSILIVVLLAVSWVTSKALTSVALPDSSRKMTL